MKSETTHFLETVGNIPLMDVATYNHEKVNFGQIQYLLI